MTDKDKETYAYYLERGAYYYRFEPTGNDAIDLILGAVAAAGKSYHNTRSWGHCDGDYDVLSLSEYEGEPSWAERIQEAADEAAKANGWTPEGGE